MECNKDEAFRAKEIAERKYEERDYHGAKKFALKAQKLFPDLDGLSQMVMALDVYISASNRVGSGAVDWYSVLGVAPWVDDDTIRKQYRKLALLLHPDKNKFLGADGAFTLVTEAWTFLSDKTRRSVYNKELSVPEMHQRVSSTATMSTMSSGSTASNGSLNLAATRNASAPSSQRSKTFWTICIKCQTHYEYMRIYLNHNLRCPNCHEAFMAIEKDPPPNVLKTANNSSRQKHQNAKHSKPQGYSNSFSGMGGPSPHNHHPQPLKREHEGVERAQKRRKSDDSYRFANFADLQGQMASGNGQAELRSVVDPSRGSVGLERNYSSNSIHLKPKSQRELSLNELREMLVCRAREKIKKALLKWSTLSEKESHHLDDSQKHSNINEADVATGKRCSSSEDRPKGNNVSASGTVITVPDPDFHNFDLDRTESSFSDEQIWAAYDENDGMPRYYARIHKVLSLKPFRLKISWLNSRNNNEFGSLEWVSSGFLKTCGDFRCGKHEITGALNSFSHMVKWTKGMRGVIRILPEKGDVWALYRNWSPAWDENTSDEVVHQYDVVEIVGDYNDGISAFPLEKVPGFKTVFKKQCDPDSVLWIPKEEMFRFSHQVPFHLLTGDEGKDAPKGCRELDPAAISLELLHIVSKGGEAREKPGAV